MTAVGDVEAVRELLAGCTEAGRLKRAVKLVDDVDFLVREPDLVIAAVAKYNVVVDVSGRTIQHGCRDFRGQAASRYLCKHVAATVLAIGAPLSATIAEELAACAAAPESGVVAPWRLEVITRFKPGG